MTDNELLELAAKAAGYKYSDIFFAGEQGLVLLGDYLHTNWNPLLDDRDALRLAITLEIDIIHAYGTRTAVAAETSGYVAEGLDPYAATRRAIVMAAAELGGLK